jgi:hypothetical protein
MATSGEKRWPPVGNFVATNGEKPMAIDSVEPNPPSSRAAGLLVCAPRSALPSWPIRVRQRRPAGLSSVVADGDVLGRLGTSWPSAPSAYSVLLLSSERVRRADPRGSIDEHQAGRQSGARLNGNAVRPPARTETKRSQPRGRSGHTARMPTPGCFWAIGGVRDRARQRRQ